MVNQRISPGWILTNVSRPFGPPVAMLEPLTGPNNPTIVNRYGLTIRQRAFGIYRQLAQHFGLRRPDTKLLYRPIPDGEMDARTWRQYLRAKKAERRYWEDHEKHRELAMIGMRKVDEDEAVERMAKEEEKEGGSEGCGTGK